VNNSGANARNAVSDPRTKGTPGFPLKIPALTRISSGPSVISGAAPPNCTAPACGGRSSLCPVKLNSANWSRLPPSHALLIRTRSHVQTWADCLRFAGKALRTKRSISGHCLRFIVVMCLVPLVYGSGSVCLFACGSQDQLASLEKRTCLTIDPSFTPVRVALAVARSLQF